MVKSWAWLLAFGLVGAWGCQPAPPTAESNTPSSNTATEAPATNSAETTPLPVSVSLPAELLSEGVAYMGADRSQRLVYNLFQDGKDMGEGTMEIRIVEVKDGMAQVDINRTGSLESMGNESMSIRKDGIYTVSLGLGTIKEPQLQIPADLKVGKKWNSNFEIKAVTGDTTKMVQSSNAAKTESVQVKAGTFDALRVDGTGTITRTTANGEKSDTKVATTSWYVKGIGLIKMEITLTGAAEQKIGVELARYQEK
ncbi:MAG: hypothetical protein KF812_08885 [Fimbriimonadaceae bacterium]|nr:hypothetical protein [Fimbriimonadaceae bacterium]